MQSLSFGDVANIISVISGLMTILGLGGFLSWSFFRVERGSLAENSISVFAFSVKTGVCLLLLGPMSLLFFPLHVVIVLAIGPNSIGGTNFYWDPSYPVAYLASYTVAGMLLFPIYILICACIYSGSFNPFRLFFRVM